MDQEIFGIFDDDGNKIDPKLVVKPSLCIMCKVHDQSPDDLLCVMNRADQVGEPEFKCGAFKPKFPTTNG